MWEAECDCEEYEVDLRRVWDVRYRQRRKKYEAKSNVRKRRRT